MRKPGGQALPALAVPKGRTAMPFYQKGDVRIRYEEVGSGFPLLVTPGGGLNSRVGIWPTAAINAMEEFKNDFRVYHDGPAQRQRRQIERPGANRKGLGRLCRRPARADGPSRRSRILFYGLLHGRLLRRQAAAAGTDRVVAAVFHQTVGERPEDPGVMIRRGRDNWLPDFKKRAARGQRRNDREILPKPVAGAARFPVQRIARVHQDCHTPILVLPDDTPSHPLQTSIDVASLAPNAEITVFPWRKPEG